MEDNFRNVLIIISAIVITAIFVHGVWTIRKQKNPYKLKTSKHKVEPITRDFDRTGFDQDGVSQVKVSKNENMPAPGLSKTKFSGHKTARHQLGQSQILRQPDMLAPTTDKAFDDSQEINAYQTMHDNQPMSVLDSSIEDNWFTEELNSVDIESPTPVINSDARQQSQPKYQSASIDKPVEKSTHNQFTKDELGDELTPTHPSSSQSPKANMIEPEQEKPIKKAPINTKPLYEQPVSRAKPERAPINKETKNPTRAELKREQMEIDFENQPNVKPIKPLTSKENVPKTRAPKAAEPKEKLEPQVIILSVVMPPNQQMLGAALLPSLLTLGLRYGEMNIFHRHQDSAGNGKVTFSLANIMNPGSFDLDTMETFATQGVSLFMTLPNAGDSFAVFEQMLSAAKQLAQEFNGQLLDDKRNVMTKQTEQHYVSKIREFDRLSRIARAE
ncbi:cell division protein ZipA [Colwellia echini]|uniref:Cell division protein ZipA n=1 Tax=Colwellia echini TaxID=1982103 RepID=A0ABY3MWA6_9GAMM|nr:cell division protein ZipA [Colwellia echini]TYK65490.1 cell division protein ZipA [Colwellia echini]